MSFAPLFFSRFSLTSRLFDGEMPPSLLPQWQWLIIYLVLIIVIAWLLISNAAASSAEQGMLSHGIPEHGAKPQAPADEYSMASDRHGPEMITAPHSSPAAEIETAAPDLTQQPIPAAIAVTTPTTEIPEPISDDLKVIEGIGPKIDSVLQAAGINTFAQLAAVDPSRLEAILREANLRLADPTTWPEQARLAAAGNWEAFDELTARLKGGRVV